MNRRAFLHFSSLSLPWLLSGTAAARQREDSINVSSLIRDALEHGKGNKLLTEYTYLMRLGERRTNKKGEATEVVEVYESYIPTLKTQGNTAAVLLQITEKGVPLSAEKIEKERQKTAERLLKAEADARKHNSRVPNEALRSKGAYFTIRLGQFFRRDLRIDVRALLQDCDFSQARRETLNGRAVIALDFAPPPDVRFDSELQYVSRLTGTVWIDAEERILTRLEGWPRDAGNRSGRAALFYEQMQLPDGYWLPRRAELNCATHPAVFGKLGVDYTVEFTDYKRFGAEAQDVKIKQP